MTIINKEAFLHNAIVVHYGKGGVGKSALSINIHFAIAKMTGLKGQLVDTDPQKTTVACMDARIEAGLETPDYVWRTSAIKANFYNEAEKYDFVTFDTQGADCPNSRVIMGFANILIIPVNTSGFVVSQLVSMLEKVVLAKANNENLKSFIVFNMVEKKNTAQIRKHKAKVQGILDSFLAKYQTTSEEIKIYICETSISYKPALYDRMSEGKTIFEIVKDKHIDPLIEYTALLAEIQEKNNIALEVAA